jgi:predicted RNase H-like nuclease (RuvC/YqgF family)
MLAFTPPANRINDAINPMMQRLVEQNRKLANELGRQQKEIEELSKELKEQDKKSN